MESLKKDPEDRFALVLGRLRECETRIRNLSTGDRMRDIDEIWEAYCDVEEGIALSNFALGAFDRLGKRRKLTVSLKDDPSRLPAGELRRKFSFVEQYVSSSIEEFSQGKGEDAVESARKARDVLKSMLIAHSSAEKRSRRNPRESQ